MRITPAEHVIREFGGVRATAKAIGRSPSAVCAWRNNLGGRVPSKCQRRILEVAGERGLDITPRDLILGRSVASEPKPEPALV